MFAKLVGVLLVLVGGCLFSGGVYLLTLGGSFFYALFGLGFFLAGVAMFRRKRIGVWIYLAVFVLMVVWSVWETGLDFWAMFSRLFLPLGFAWLVAFAGSSLPDSSKTARKTALVSGFGLLIAFCLFFALTLTPHGVIQNEATFTPGEVSGVTEAAGNEWRDYGRTGEGVRYAPFDQINTGNVGSLEVAWTTRHGDIATYGNENQNTPLYVDGVLYHCSPRNIVSAIDATNGKILWQFDAEAESPTWNRCRSLAYFDPAEHPARAEQDICGPRIVMATIDARIMAIRARDGALCESFGDGGTVDGTVGIGEIQRQDLYMFTHGATIAGDKIVVGSNVGDNVMVGEPSGVVRAWDAVTGELAWAWDLANPAITDYPPEGETYTRGTPNVWAPMAYDLDLGLLYLPMGNETPDHYGGTRMPESEDYASAIVALDLETGRERWRYQTVHHDIWDYDLPSQPALVDLPGENGEKIPAVIQLTKRGQIFMLNRITGEPIAQVEERPVPAGDAKGEWYAKTQPFSVGMPVIGAEPLQEKQAWGMTILDQLYCRIQFKKHLYVGDFTPMSEAPFLFYPGNGGGFNWGSASIDQQRHLLLVNDIRMPISGRLMPREEIDQMGLLPPHDIYTSQQGTPYGFFRANFLSPLYVPCMQPPYGTVTAIDLVSRQIVWQRPIGTAKEVGPMGIRLGIPFEVGMPTLGGMVTTSGGLAFFSGTQDYYLRAIDTETGEVLWKAPLPSGGQATPMTYIDDRDGRQYVLVNASGAPGNKRDRADYLIAFALPES